jgi:hypothetical protein
VRREVPQGGRFVPASVVRGTRGGHTSETSAKIVKNYAMMAGHWNGSDSMFLHRRWLQKLGINVPVLDANLVVMCMPYGDAYHTMSATRNAGASVQRDVVVRQSQLRSHQRLVVRNERSVMGTLSSGIRSHQEHFSKRFDRYE